ncbi:MAG: response regulator transcription factor [Clostridiales bacterium]|nr:response regulator transcription factor [Clostridiales bacterium]
MRILIIEDEKETAKDLRSVLRKEGYETDAVYDGSSGLDYMLTDVYDLVMLDITLPKPGGLDVLLKARAEGIQTPVIVLSEKFRIEEKILVLDSGADDYLTKPVAAGELFACIRARTRRSGIKSPDMLQAYDLRLDKTTFRLFGKDSSVKLAKKEYQLMEYLMINKGRILPRELLITKIWGLEEKNEYNNLDVYISFLRKKLKCVEAQARIDTKKGVGYSLEP